MAKKKETHEKPINPKAKATPKKKKVVDKKTSKKTRGELQKIVTDKKCLEACSLIEGGLSVRKAMKAKKLSSKTFYAWVDADTDNRKQFARACEDRHDMIFEECLEIADKEEEDKKFWGNTKVSRAKLQIQTRLDMLARMNPKKYSPRHIVEGGDNPIKTEVKVINLGGGLDPAEDKPE